MKKKQNGLGLRAVARLRVEGGPNRDARRGRRGFGSAEKRGHRAPPAVSRRRHTWSPRATIQSEGRGGRSARREEERGGERRRSVSTMDSSEGRARLWRHTHVGAPAGDGELNALARVGGVEGAGWQGRDPARRRAPAALEEAAESEEPSVGHRCAEWRRNADAIGCASKWETSKGAGRVGAGAGVGPSSGTGIVTMLSLGRTPLVKSDRSIRSIARTITRSIDRPGRSTEWAGEDENTRAQSEGSWGGGWLLPNYRPPRKAM